MSRSSSQQKQTITFRSAAEMLDVFGMHQGGSQYRRLIATFQSVVGPTIFFGTDTQREKAAVTHQARFNFMREARIWYSRNPNQALLPGGFENVIVLSDEFYREVMAHSIPTDLEAAKALSSTPAALDPYMWLSYRCFTVKEARAHSDLHGVRTGRATRECRVFQAAKISRAARTMARSDSLFMAGLPRADPCRWRIVGSRSKQSTR